MRISKEKSIKMFTSCLIYRVFQTNGTQTNVNNHLTTKTPKVQFAHNKLESVLIMQF